MLKRLNEIGRSFSKRPHSLALIGLGSVGKELDRLDDYSDLDFFAIVEDGHQQSFLNDLTWLTEIAPVDFHFLNTADGYKLLYADGIFCEMAVFDQSKLTSIPFSAGRIVWKAVGVSGEIANPKLPLDTAKSRPEEWILGEALTNLYVGLLRDQRGETLTAMRFIQHYALDRTIELASRREPAQNVHADIFSPERRLEQRLPHFAQYLPQMTQGYTHNTESAVAILSFLDNHFDLNQKMVQAIRELCD
ncbi:MAG: hypothetical protein AAF902_10010 [Chloroflexota bacterium]